MKSVTDDLAAELGLDSTKLCRLWKITLTIPGAAEPLKVIRITDHDQDIPFVDD